ncbi:MAG: flagellar biosynthetic protein FliR [Myxococcales bacterium]|nr:flagellar biosynthetic protein FliR [Myxococcales bacterium]USN49869.1 MAG: flagellar biosynthetic protein FliR [Myxococcales bacterium]
MNVDHFSHFLDDPKLHHYLLIFLLIFTRWLSLSLITPIFGAALLPAIVRIGLAFSMSTLSFLTIYNENLVFEKNIIFISALFIKEGLIGFILGFFISLIFFAYEMAGQFIDNARAASMAKMLVPELRVHSSPMGTMFFQLSLALFVVLGLHRSIILTAYKSFEEFQVTSLNINVSYEYILALSLKLLSSLFVFATKLALPVIIICFLIDCAFGLMNRVAPQINAYFLSLPAKIVSGLIMLFLCLTFLLDDFLQHYQLFKIFSEGLFSFP